MKYSTTENLLLVRYIIQCINNFSNDCDSHWTQISEVRLETQRVNVTAFNLFSLFNRMVNFLPRRWMSGCRREKMLFKQLFTHTDEREARMLCNHLHRALCSFKVLSLVC